MNFNRMDGAMKQGVVAVAVFLVLAGTSWAKQKEAPKSCQHLGQLYQMAASLRDQGRDRDVVFTQLQVMAEKIKGYYIAEDQLFSIADDVYYSAAFADKHGEALRKEIEWQCASGQLPDVFIKR